MVVGREGAIVRGFMMSLDVAEKFFKRCAEQRAGTIEARIKIMHELVHEENIQIVKETQMQDVIKNKKVLVVKQKKERKNV